MDLFRKKDPNVHTPSREQKKASKKREKDITKLINRAFDLWRDHLDQVRSTLPDEARGEIPPERIKQDLETFVQNNVLGGQKISAMSNAQDITHYVNALSGVPAAAPTAPVAAPTAPATAPTAPPAAGASMTDRMSQAATPAAPGVEPAPVEEPREPILKDPNFSDSTKVQRVKNDPLILKREKGRTEYTLDPETKQWTVLGSKDSKPVRGSISMLLNQAMAEFSENDDILGINLPPEEEGEWVKNPETGKPEWHPAAQPTAAQPATDTPEQPPQRRSPPSAEELQARYRAQRELDAAEKAKFDQASAAALAKAEQDRLAADAAERAAGTEPASRGLVNVGGRYEKAQYEPIKESLRRKIAQGEITLAEARVIYQQFKSAVLREADEKLSVAREKELFGKLIRAAVLARPTSGTVAPRARTTGTSGSQTPSPSARDAVAPSAPATSAPQVHDEDIGNAAEILDGSDSSSQKGRQLQRRFNSDKQVASTGNAAADAALLAMGFKIR